MNYAGKNGLGERIVTIGGTFDVLHEGHKEYIRLAFEFGDYVIIYVNANGCARTEKFKSKEYEKRVHAIETFISEIGVDATRYTICKLYSPSQLKEDYLAIEIYLAIVTPEYYPLLHTLNQHRLDHGEKAVLILVKERTRNSNGDDLSSSAIKKNSVIDARFVHRMTASS